MSKISELIAQSVRIPFAGFELSGDLVVPPEATGVVLFAHGSGSSRHSPRNQFVARVFHSRGLGTLLFDLLTVKEEQLDSLTGHLRFNIDLLAKRLHTAATWFCAQHSSLPLGYFGSSTGAAAALVAASRRTPHVSAVVSRGGRPDLAAEALPIVTAPTLLIVGSEDRAVVEMNRTAYEQLRCTRKLELVEGATHLFEEPGTLEQAARLAADWFALHFSSEPPASIH